MRRPYTPCHARAVRSDQPYWLVRNGIGDSGRPLDHPLDCEIAIVGAGITGALIADEFRDAGGDVVILDDRDAGLGSTSASTALLQYELDVHLVDLVARLGRERAHLAYLSGVASLERLAALATELPECDFVRRASLYLASAAKDLPTLHDEVAARLDAGLDVKWMDADTLADRFGIRRPGAILSASAAQIDPLRTARALLRRCVATGMHFHANSRVARIDGIDSALLLHLSTGQTVSAQQAIIACGYESLRFLPAPVAALHSTFALVTTPRTHAASAPGQPLLWECARPYVYLRDTADGRIMMGGGDVPFRSAVARDALIGSKVRHLQEQYATLFGASLPPVAMAWAGTFGETADGLPHIGTAPGVDPRIHFALCFGGNGITYSAQAGAIIRAAIERRPHPLGELFGFQRLR